MGKEIMLDPGDSISKKVLSNELADAIRALGPLLPGPKNQALTNISQMDQGTIFLLIDCSGTMQKNRKLEQVKDGLLDYSQDAIKRGYSIGIIKFENEASLLHKPGKNIQEIKQILKDLQAGGFTNMVDAISMARSLLIDKSHYRGMIIVTDGMPNGTGDPEASLKKASEARREGIHIDAIGTDDAKEEFLKHLNQ